MIELLIVIAILGILAVAVLSAINPLEQINRGRDTGAQSDAEQLLNAIERFNAFQGHFPWDPSRNATSFDIDVPWTQVSDGTAGTAWLVNAGAGAPALAGADANCTILDRLGPGGTGTTCSIGANELKDSFLTRVGGASALRALWIKKLDNTQNTEIYVCFAPQSSAFQEVARQRCIEEAPDATTEFPTEACPAAPTAADPQRVCLP